MTENGLLEIPVLKILVKELQSKMEDFKNAYGFLIADKGNHIKLNTRQIRSNNIMIYNVKDSSSEEISERIEADKKEALTFQKINRIITEVDSQPMFDGGVLINVLGRLQVSIHSIIKLEIGDRNPIHPKEEEEEEEEEEKFSHLKHISLAIIPISD
ncbi:unnamed protein product [Phaedon cochleariae]|uniref:Uncharacterized protein n=1 Tax=Phaedon cochleariae TaxID=80249 RepID=A0A9N9SEG0_PHACE|nr:unnamed protein product [Phaedon cochleariae]